MTNESKTSVLRILLLINNKRLTQKATQLFDMGNIPVHLRFAAHGTASSEMMDILGLGGIEKDVTATVMPKIFADEMLLKISKELKLNQKNSGIAFTIPLSGINSLFMKINERKIDIDAETKSKEKEIVNMSETKHSVIVATVNQGYSEEVMNAARSNGAKGGTVFHTNCIINDETMNFWNLDFNEEKETVLIITDNDKKLGIMKAISESCGINTKANGLVLSIPIDNIMGINTGEH